MQGADYGVYSSECSSVRGYGLRSMALRESFDLILPGSEQEECDVLEFREQEWERESDDQDESDNELWKLEFVRGATGPRGRAGRVGSLWCSKNSREVDA